MRAGVERRFDALDLRGVGRAAERRPPWWGSAATCPSRPPRCARRCASSGVTTLFLTTALLNQLSHEQPDIFAPLREVLFGGEAVDADSVRRLLQAGRPQRLLHMYGPTETTTFCLSSRWSTSRRTRRPSRWARRSRNQRIYVLDGGA